jgi:HSP20 family molecular chaperone IbpA
MANGEWSLRVDISENDGAFLIKAEIPGVCKENVKATLENGVFHPPNNVDGQHLKTPETQSSSITVPVD